MCENRCGACAWELNENGRCYQCDNVYGEAENSTQDQTNIGWLTSTDEELGDDLDGFIVDTESSSSSSDESDYGPALTDTEGEEEIRKAEESLAASQSAGSQNDQRSTRYSSMATRSYDPLNVHSNSDSHGGDLYPDNVRAVRRLRNVVICGRDVDSANESSNHPVMSGQSNEESSGAASTSGYSAYNLLTGHTGHGRVPNFFATTINTSPESKYNSRSRSSSSGSGSRGESSDHLVMSGESSGAASTSGYSAYNLLTGHTGHGRVPNFFATTINTSSESKYNSRSRSSSRGSGSRGESSDHLVMSGESSGAASTSGYSAYNLLTGHTGHGRVPNFFATTINTSPESKYNSRSRSSGSGSGSGSRGESSDHLVMSGENNEESSGAASTSGYSAYNLLTRFTGHGRIPNFFATTINTSPESKDNSRSRSRSSGSGSSSSGSGNIQSTIYGNTDDASGSNDTTNNTQTSNSDCDRQRHRAMSFFSNFWSSGRSSESESEQSMEGTSRSSSIDPDDYYTARTSFPEEPEVTSSEEDNCDTTDSEDYIVLPRSRKRVNMEYHGNPRQKQAKRR
ncbi:hypothetical protein BX666DRAFT_424757 [Dichotomocladium elegans]|nr:hypothetical protein BX666DRAFT_424757 [Dichotomocladium elegans]